MHAGKSHEQLGKRQQRRRKAEIKKALTTACAGLSNIGLSLTSVQLKTNSNEKLHLHIEPLQDITNTDTSKTDKEQIQQIMYLMLKHGVSFNFYHELCSIFKDLSRAYKVQNC